MGENKVVPEAWGSENGEEWFMKGHHPDHVARAAALAFEEECGTLDDQREAIMVATVGRFWWLECCYDDLEDTDERRGHIVAEGTRDAKPYTQVMA